MSPEPDAAGALLATQSLQAAIARDGFVFVPAAATATLLGARDDWDSFAASWNPMPLDRYMADGGRYRRRRYATLSVSAGETVATLAPHQPHYQSIDYNHLHGDIERHFEPIAPHLLADSTFVSIMALCCTVFNRLRPGVRWHVEVHQFRIEARRGESGQPTPEGVHRDGVDYVMVMMVRRHNIREGTTTIHSPAGQQLASFTLVEPLDLTLVDDHRCLHGVTPVEPVDPSQPAWRDVLVVTFRVAGDIT